MTPPTPPKTVRYRPQAGALSPVVARGLKVPLFDDFYHTVLRWPWWRFFAFVCAAFLVMNGLFAVAYTLAPGSVSNARSGNFEDAFFFSVQTFATIGYGGMAPETLAGHVIVTVEALTGILSVAIITGLTFAKFARPTARVIFSEKMVIGTRDGERYLMFRVANARRNFVVEAQLRVIILLEEKTAEGDVIRRPVPLPLVRDSNAFFVLTWLAMHRIDEKSPFFGADAIERLRAQKAEMILSLSGLDDTIGQMIHERYTYALSDIVENARFIDVLHVRDDGVREIDYSKFHLTEPQKPAAAERKLA